MMNGDGPQYGCEPGGTYGWVNPVRIDVESRSSYMEQSEVAPPVNKGKLVMADEDGVTYGKTITINGDGTITTTTPSGSYTEPVNGPTETPGAGTSDPEPPPEPPCEPTPDNICPPIDPPCEPTPDNVCPPIDDSITPNYSYTPSYTDDN